mmetsp:Transcript_24944/g.34373  ORF Transcript_24944/g.34373 Transcript_24944/m.34373 type:complete len:131 (-) Transcript_24944:110-502(-)
MMSTVAGLRMCSSTKAGKSFERLKCKTTSLRLKSLKTSCSKVVASPRVSNVADVRGSVNHAVHRRSLFIGGALAAAIMSFHSMPVEAADVKKCMKQCVKECNVVAPGSPEYCKENCQEECQARAEEELKE